MSTHNQKSELKRAFLCHLPNRIAAIEEIWASLKGEDWSRETLSALYQRVQALARSSSNFGLLSVSENAAVLQDFLSGFFDHGERPDPSRLARLVAALRDAAELESRPNAIAARADAAPDSSSDAAVKQLIYVLEQPPRVREGLCAALGAQDFTTHAFQDLSVLKSSLEEQRPDLLISDLELLPGLKSTGVTDVLQVDGAARVPMILIGNPVELEQRLSAMRSGCDVIVPTQADNAALADKVADMLTPKHSERFKILIVEDDQAQAEHVAAILKKARMQTRVVLDPLEVLGNIRDFKPDLILMDLYMPGANGVEITTIIRDYPEFIDVPIVFLSGEHDPEKQLSALSAGGEDFLDKPIRPKHLITTVTNRINRVRALGTSFAGTAVRDSITGLLNRNALFEQLDNVISSESQNGGSTGVLFVGIDAVDNLLDSLSLVGIDQLLAALGDSLFEKLDAQDNIARFGDFSFVALAQRRNTRELSDLAERLCYAVESKLFELEEKALSVTVSIGLHLVDGAADDAASVVARAEKAYRIARDAGGNRTHVFAPGTAKDKTRRKTQWLRELMTMALETDGFEVLFQPIVPLRGGEGEHYQTLLRLHGEDGEFIPAAEFIPVAESSDLILRLDQWITQYALSVIRERHSQGGKIHLFVSQSVASLNDPARPVWLRQQVESLELAGTELTFEFNLPALASDLRSAKTRFELLQSMGISVLLTQVTGESAHKKLLKRLMADYVKLSVEPLVGRQEDMAALIEEVHEMGTPVIAPRIENPQVIAQLWISGVDFIQGNFIQRPDQKLGYDFSESILA